MAFNFLGTMSNTDLESLRKFLRAEIENTDNHINSLIVEIANLKKTKAELQNADNIMGGNALTEMQQDILAKKMPRFNDTNPAILTSKIKEPFIANIKYKRERLEYKIKKITDTIEQKYKERDIRLIARTETFELLNKLNSLFTNANAKFLYRTEQDKQNAEKLYDQERA